jgi:hypothetical protein
VADATQLYCTTIGSSAIGELKSFSFARTPNITVQNLQAPSAIAIDGTDILYSSFAGVVRIPNSLSPEPGMTIIPRVDFGTGASVYGITHDGTFVYVLTSSVGGKAVVWRWRRTGGALEPVTVPLDVKSGGARGLLLVDSDLYFVREPPIMNQALDNSALQRISKTANAGTPLEMGGANQSNLVTDGTYVYYANGNDLLSLPK